MDRPCSCPQIAGATIAYTKYPGIADGLSRNVNTPASTLGIFGQFQSSGGVEMKSFPKTLFLHNPTAGAKHPSAEELLIAATQAGIHSTYVSTKDKRYKAALRKNWDLVIVAGGDGTVGRAVRELKDRSIPLAILPTGTANNIARSLGIVGEPKSLLSQLSAAPIKSLDVGLAKGPWGKSLFLEAVGLGAIAEAISHSGPKPPKAIRITAGREELQEFVKEAEAERLEISVDGEVLAGEFLLVEILNLNFTGPALPLAYSAAPDDRLLDVAFLFESERAKMLAWLDAHPEHMPPPIMVRRGQKVQLEWEYGYLRIDSEIYLPPKKPSPVKVTLQKKSLRVLVPRTDSLPATASP
jgi:diacylglycerol kinase (ATP)